jgi:hypothetical protein
MAEHLFQFVPRPKIENFSPISFFDKLLEFDQSLRKMLSNFPSGPLMKALDFIKEDNKPVIFSPLRAYLPQNLLNISYKGKNITWITSGSATSQSDISTAEIDPIFHVFLNQLAGQSTVIIDLEDLNNIYSKARVRSILTLARQDLVCSVIPRSGLLYTQGDIYAFINDSVEFKKVVLEQFEEDEGLNYSESQLYRKDIMPIFEMILSGFFDNKTQLEFKERLVFIELLQLFMAVAVMNKYQADNVIVMCKDGLDHSNAYGLSMYALITLVHHDHLLDKNHMEFFISELYGPAMTLRDRPIFEESFVRMAQALSLLHSKLIQEPQMAEKIFKVLPLLKDLKLKAS